MDKTEIYIQKEVSLKSPVLIEGLPGLGLVGRIAAEHLIKELKAEKFGELYSPSFPPYVMIETDATLRMMKDDFYYWTAEEKNQKDLIILVGDHQGLTPDSYYSIAGSILDTVENYKTKMIFTLGGFGIGRMCKDPKVFGATTHKPLIRQFKKYGVIFERRGGPIIGAAGLLLGLGQLRGMQGVCLMGETHGNYADPKAAKNVLTVVCKALNLNINFDALDKKAKEIEEMILRYEKIQKTQQQPLPSIELPKDESATYIR